MTNICDMNLKLSAEKQQILAHFGTQANLANQLGVSRPSVNVWFKRGQPIPALRAIEISQMMNGSIDPVAINPKAERLLAILGG